MTQSSRAALLALLAVLAHGANASAAPTRFSVTVTGKGQDVVLIPGLATPGVVWDATAEHLGPWATVEMAQKMGVPQAMVDGQYSGALRRSRGR